MKIAIISDAGPPQINGVVRTLQATIKELEQRGHEVCFITPERFKTIAVPGYSEIRLVRSTRGLETRLRTFNPDYIHIATEGPLGWATRKICMRLGWNFTTAYHTDFPRYLKKHYLVPECITYAVLRKFHEQSSSIMVSTQSITDLLSQHGFNNIKRWGRGVDTKLFRPVGSPIGFLRQFLYVGRVSKEKNLEAFLDIDIEPYKKVVVGSGPMLETYKKQYPEVQFLGPKTGEDLATVYSESDCFVFPSKTDTFGLVIIEAMACGTPVAAYPVQGPIDIITPETGVMDDNLREAMRKAIKLDRNKIAEQGQKFTWQAATDQFISALVAR